MADALSKHGGAQVGYRLASARQELQVDRQPSLPAVKDYAEFLQAEAEDLALMATSHQGTAKGASTAATSATAPQASVKAFGGGGGLNGTESPEKKPKQACRYWGTQEGCKRADSCTFAHSWDNINKNNRCFHCSGETILLRIVPMVATGPQRTSRRMPRSREVERLPRSKKMNLKSLTLHRLHRPRP